MGVSGDDRASVGRNSGKGKNRKAFERIPTCELE
jgi:hypothetical protein